MITELNFDDEEYHVASIKPEDTQKEWDKIVSDLVNNIRTGKVVDGIEAGVKRCGEILLEKGFRKTTDDVNELRDDLRIN